MSTHKPHIKVGYSTFVDDDLDDEYESCSDGGDNAFSDSIRPSAPLATTLLVPASPTVTSARVISRGSNANANSNRLNSSPIAASSPPGAPVVLGARVVRAGRPSAQINQRAAPVAMPTQSSAPVSVVGARVVAPSPHRQIMQVVTVVGQPAVVASPLPAAYYPGAGAAPKVVAARVISPSRS